MAIGTYRGLLLVGLIGVLPLPVASFAQEPPGRPRIAVLLPETGPFAPLGEQQRRGYKLAEAQLQEQGQGLDVRTFDAGPPDSDVRDLLYRQVLPWRPAVVVGPYDSR